jgi:predicted membrane channel-forming protein YqfA (hemolysin III family)
LPPIEGCASIATGWDGICGLKSMVPLWGWIAVGLVVLSTTAYITGVLLYIMKVI